MKKTERIITYCIVAVSLIAVLAMGLHLELKLSRLSEIDPVVVYTPESTAMHQSYATTSAAFTYESTIYDTNRNTTLLQSSSESTTTENYSDASASQTEALSATAVTTQLITDTTATVSISDNHSSSGIDYTEAASVPIIEPQSAFPESKTQPSTSKAAVRPEDAELFVTKSGDKFHLAGCSYLSKSCIAITYDEAMEKGFSPCSRCFKDIKE